MGVRCIVASALLSFGKESLANQVSMFEFYEKSFGGGEDTWSGGATSRKILCLGISACGRSMISISTFSLEKQGSQAAVAS